MLSSYDGGIFVIFFLQLLVLNVAYYIMKIYAAVYSIRFIHTEI